MAERRPPGFNVPLGFYDGPEVKSIPRRIRAAAVGVWALCGSFSATKLQDGYVGAEALKDLGCTDAIRAALMSTLGPDGEPDPLWEPARDGGIQFTKWVKYQRSRDEVKAYRNADAERKKAERLAARNATASGKPKTSERTPSGHVPDHRDPKTETETKTEFGSSTAVSALNVDPPRDVERGLSEPVSASASRVLHDTLRGQYPAPVLTTLRHKASELMNRDGVTADVLAETVRCWEAKPDVGPSALPMFVAEAVKALQAPAVSASGQHSKIAGWLATGTPAADPFDQPHDHPREIMR